MFTFTTVISDPTRARLQKLCDRTNKTEPKPLSLTEWLELNLKEMAIQQDLSAAIPGLQTDQQAASETALTEAIASRRRELLDQL